MNDWGGLPFDSEKRHTRKQFPWVSDGIYDHAQYQVRYEVIQGYVMTAISKMWTDKGGPATVSKALRLPWGTYPDIPKKPQK